jgi:hypothetical protein
MEKLLHTILTTVNHYHTKLIRERKRSNIRCYAERNTEYVSFNDMEIYIEELEVEG